MSDDTATPTGRDGRPAVGASTAERVIVVASVLLVVATLGFVAWQAVVTPERADPTAGVETVVAAEDGGLRVTVTLDNGRGQGLEWVRLEVRCGGVVRPLTFSHVPAGGRRTGTVVCPAGTAPDAEVVAWVAV